MTITEQQLLELKDKIDAAKQTVSELTGQKQALMRQLKEDWGCETVEDAEVKLDAMDNSIAVLDRRIKNGIKDLEKEITIPAGI